jgi:hypothetical protein
MKRIFTLALLLFAVCSSGRVLAKTEFVPVASTKERYRGGNYREGGVARREECYRGGGYRDRDVYRPWDSPRSRGIVYPVPTDDNRYDGVIYKKPRPVRDYRDGYGRGVYPGGVYEGGGPYINPYRGGYGTGGYRYEIEWFPGK